MSSHSLVTRTIRLTAVAALLIVAGLALSTTLSADGADPSPQPPELGVAWQFNGFFCEDFSASSSHIEGRLGAGGDVSLNNFSVARRLRNMAPGDTLVVGGDLTFPRGRVRAGDIRVASSEFLICLVILLVITLKMALVSERIQIFQKVRSRMLLMT